MTGTVSSMDKIYPLSGTAQHYHWGGRQYIASLVGDDGDAPIAEWWLGAHPKAPASLIGRGMTLDRAIAENPMATLGEKVARRFGELPFLFKILDVEGMQSIRVDNHKPKMMMALSRFYMLYGFRPEGAICLHLAAYEATRDLALIVARKGLKQGYAEVMNLPPADVSRRIQAILGALANWPELDEEVPEYWLIRAVQEKGSDADNGLFSFFFMNLLAMEAGQVIHQPIGLPHAYLRGRAIELMSNSDSLLRVGLTSKAVDIPQLLAGLSYQGTRPRPDRAERIGVIHRYAGFCQDFALDDMQFGQHSGMLLFSTELLYSMGPEILFILDGEATLQHGRQFQAFRRGKSLFVEAGASYRIFGESGTRLFRARTNIPDDA